MIPIIKTHYSILSGFIKPDEAAIKCKELGYTHCILGDDNLGGVVDFYIQMTENGIVPIIGLRKNGVLYIAKTLLGYKHLIKIASDVRTDEYESKDLEIFDECDLPIFNVLYANKEDALLHQILLCIKHKKTLKQSSQITGEDSVYFHTDEFHFRKIDESYFIEEMILAGKKIIDELEPYSILSPPRLPRLYPTIEEENDAVRQICRDGWKEKLGDLPKDKVKLYVDRVKTELDIITKYGLSAYFLIVYDIMKFVGDNGWKKSPGRGSVGGSLVAYLMGITTVDSIKYDLYFSRFLNAGRFSEGKISLPDIDMDVPKRHRDSIIQYVKDKYGKNKVCQMITFGRLKGRSAIKEIARVCDFLSPTEANELTDMFPSESMVADELEEMEIKSVIMWTLENYPKKLEKWAYLENGEIQGEYKELFDLALRLENTYKSIGTHPAGIIISDEDIINNAPLIYEDGEPYIALEMGALEKGGLVKFDILAVNILDKNAEITAKEDIYAIQ